MFENDLKEWKKAEREFAARLLQWDVRKLEIVPDNVQFKDYDIKATINKNGKDVEATYEVKTNPIFNTTGDVCFEVSCNGVPSGVYSSKADYIVYKLWPNFYYQDRWKLLLMLNKLPHEEKMGWDGGRCTLYIVKWEYLSDLFNML